MIAHPLLSLLALSSPNEPATQVDPLVAGVVLFVAVVAMASLGALFWKGAAQTREVIVAMAREIRSEMRAWVNSVDGWYRAPWRRHGRLIADLPLTPASAAKHGELIAVSGRVEAGDDEAEAGHLLLADDSGGHLQIGRPGQALVTERFAAGDLVFAMGEVERLDHTGHPFRDAAPTAVAMTTGVKSYNGTLGITQGANIKDCATAKSNGTTSLWEIAADEGMATGVISTARLTHATPAATYAETTERDWESDKDVSAAGKAAEANRRPMPASTNAARVRLSSARNRAT